MTINRRRAPSSEISREKKLSGQMGVPVIDIDGEVIIGFQPNIFDELLSK